MDEILGRYKVKMHGWWWFWFKDKKIIEWDHSRALSRIVGYNILWGFIKWGKFEVQEVGDYFWRFKYAHFTDMVKKDSMTGSLRWRGHRCATFDLVKL